MANQESTSNQRTMKARLFIPEDVRRPGSPFRYGALVDVIDWHPPNNPGRVKVRIDGCEINMEKRFIDGV